MSVRPSYREFQSLRFGSVKLIGDQSNLKVCEEKKNNSEGLNQISLQPKLLILTWSTTYSIFKFFALMVSEPIEFKEGE